jgi:hypothetical protein
MFIKNSICKTKTKSNISIELVEDILVLYLEEFTRTKLSIYSDIGIFGFLKTEGIAKYYEIVFIQNLRMSIRPDYVTIE